MKNEVFDYKQNPFTLVYEDAIAKNESGKVNIQDRGRYAHRDLLEVRIHQYRDRQADTVLR